MASLTTWYCATGRRQNKASNTHGTVPCVACPTEERNAAVMGLIFPVPTVDGMVLEALFLLFPMHLQLATAGVGAGTLW